MPIPKQALITVVCGGNPAAGHTALDHLLAKGRVVHDASGQVRLNPVFRRRGADIVLPLARATVEQACALAPASLSLQVARLGLLDWDAPGVERDVAGLLERALGAAGA